MIRKLFKLPRRNIALVQYIIEGYEGMATVTTSESSKAIIQVLIIPDYFEETMNVIESLKDKYQVIEILEC